ncbi:MAG: Ldh family oxidoreductase [Caulobacterales bacterium]|nr:Ldh family oxidoreductase [Caulobacterales bacterium]
MSKVTLSIEEALALARAALQKTGASAQNAEATARALVAAEVDGQGGHGLARVPSYAGQARSGKVDGAARPTLQELSPAVVAVDAAHGFAYPAIAMAVDALAERAGRVGVSAASVRRSHHFGQGGAHAEALAERGLIGLVFGNSPEAIAFWGSTKPALGTNPIAFAAPAPGGPPLVIDLALSVAARGKIIAAQKNGEPIPEGWALDREGRPTTDPGAALQGSMAPVGGVKGAALALMVEILAAALTGAHFGFEASSLFSDDGGPPNLGQTLIALDPEMLSGGAYLERMTVLLAAIEAADGARPPGVSRLANRERARRDGLAISQPLYDEIRALAGVSG